MAASLFNGNAVKILKNILRFKDGTEISSTDAGNLVTNASTSTDNAVARFDATTGKIIQNSGVTIDDSDNVTIPGDLTVNGTTTTINTATLDVEDTNITVNNTGNDASAEGAGLTVERTGTDGSFIYEDALTSKFKLGALGSEVEVADVSSSQTLTNKTINADSNTISNIDNDEIKAAAAIALDKLAATTASRALQSDASGFITASSVTNTELSYVSGVTSAIQTQLNTKATIADVFNVTTSSGTFAATANATHFVNTSGGAATVTLPAASTDRFVRIKDISGNANTNNITVNTPGAETIDGDSSHVMDSNYGSKVFVSDGTNWYIL